MLRAIILRFSGGNRSRGIRQLKDFMGAVSDSRQSAVDQLSDGHEAVASDNSDDENTARRQPSSRFAAGRARGRPGGRFSKMHPHSGERAGDVVERQRYSNVCGRGIQNSGGSQGRGFRRSDRRSGDDEHRPYISAGSENEGAAERQKHHNRQSAYTGSVRRGENWNEASEMSRASRVVEQHREHLQPADEVMAAPQLPASGRRVPENAGRSQRPENKQMPRDQPRRVHPTRTISNSHFHTAAENVPSRDRGSQISGIVEAMNKISVKTAADDSHGVTASQHEAPRSALIVSGLSFCSFAI